MTRFPISISAFAAGWMACALVACSTDNSLKASDNTGHWNDTAGGDSLDSDSAPPAEPSWFTPRAVIDVTDGVPSLSQLTLIVVDADLVTVVCELPQDVSAAVEATSPDASVSLWLNVPLTPTADDCAQLPSPIGLGIGELPADVRAQLGPSGLSDVASSLLGAFTRAPDDETSDVSAFGYAGTPDDLAGDDVATLPPPDGQYVLNPLFLLHLPTGG